MTSLRGKWRRFWFGLQTASGIRRRGYFSPSRHAAAADPAACLSPELERRFADRDAAMRDRVRRLDEFVAPFDAIGGNVAPSPRWDQDWFPRLDAAMAYAITRTEKPRHIVEVGSGHSTRFFCQAVRDGRLDTEILSIDPEPRAGPGDFPKLRLCRTLVQHAGTELFRTLESGDILSIDSGHVLMPGSDVDFLMNVALPLLPPGVLVHFHDIFLPDPYPESWSWRGYNEQAAVAMLIQHAGWRIEFSSRYAATRLADDVAHSIVDRIALVPGAFESSLWLTVGK